MSSGKLESFFKETKKQEDDIKEHIKMFKKTSQENFEILEPEIETPTNLGECILLSVDYDGAKERIYTKLYSPKENKIFFWYDNTNHHPYCLTDLSESELRQNEKLMSHRGLLSLKKVKKKDLLHNIERNMIKIEARDPLSIGGRRDSVRELLTRSWEDRIRYHHSYIMDRSLTPGARYIIKNNSLKEAPYNIEDKQLEEIKYRFSKDLEKYEDILRRYLPRILDPVPYLSRTAMDIEVESLVDERIPDPKAATNKVIAVSFAGDKGEDVVYLLKNSLELGEKPEGMPSTLNLEFFEDEKELLSKVFTKLNQIPILITFNGDNFDLKYLYYRAQNLGIPKEKIPIVFTGDSASLKYGIHIDLYPFFHNVSIRIYAFGNKYMQSTLNEISKSLLQQEKIEIENFTGKIPPLQLAYYCWNDAKLTLTLTEFNNNLAMKLIILLMRISHLPIEDITRTAVSAWIRNLIFYEHRQKNYLIPNQEDILKEKGQINSKAIIKGKKFKGAIVIEPIKGTHFNVTVLDFASLYPSIIKEYNLSYETVECPHPECKDNKLPGTNYWVCKKKTGIISSIVGFLRDTRANWFKTKSKDKNIPEQLRQYYKVVEQALKVFINASYGVLGSENFPLYTPLVADSTTAIGRYAITKVIEESKKLGLTVLYGDSVAKDTVVYLEDKKEVEINELFKRIDFTNNGKEYYYPKNLRVLTLNENGKTCFRNIKYIMRHKTNKKMYRIQLTDSLFVDITEDHSIIGYDLNKKTDNTLEKITPLTPKDIRKGVEFIVCLENGEGRDFITMPAKKITEINYNDYVYDFEVEGTHTFFANKILVHNTDSVFLKNPSKEQIDALIAWSSKNLGIDLDVDKVYRYVALSDRKKNYLGVYENGDVDIKGLTGKKKHVPVFIQNAFNEMIKILSEVRSESEFESAKEKIKQLATALYQQLTKKQIPLEQLAFKVQMNKPLSSYTKTTPQHVKAAKLLLNMGKDVQAGDIITFVKTKDELGVKPLELADWRDVDIDKYREYIESTFEQVLDALDIDFKEIMGIKKLSEFFS
ncbi:MAG: DNA polymerase domain-containing protein [Candidatus Odinarchaeia archaeon]